MNTVHEPPPQPTPANRVDTDPIAHRGTAGRLRRWSARHPVTAFLVIGFAIAYPVMSLPILASHGVIPDGWMPQTAGVDTERIASVLWLFVALLPAALWVTWAADGADGVRVLGAGCCGGRSGRGGGSWSWPGCPG